MECMIGEHWATGSALDGCMMLAFHWATISFHSVQSLLGVSVVIHYNINNKQKRDTSCGVVFLSHFSIPKFFCFLLPEVLDFYSFLTLCVDKFLYLFYNLILNHSYLAARTQHHVCPILFSYFEQASTCSYSLFFDIIILANLRALCFVPTSLDDGSGLEGYPKTKLHNTLDKIANA